MPRNGTLADPRLKMMGIWGSGTAAERPRIQLPTMPNNWTVRINFLNKAEHHTTRGRRRNKMTVRSVTRALSILECFDADRPSLALHQISQRLELAKSTTYRLLSTLVESGYVVQKENSEYCLSFQLFTEAQQGLCLWPHCPNRNSLLFWISSRKNWYQDANCFASR